MEILTIQRVLKEKNLRVFTAQDLQRFLQISPIASQKVLERYTKKGVFGRLKKGKYILKANPPSSFAIANSVYQPSYISFESALSFYGIIPESVFSITCATPLPTKSWQILGKNFEFLKIKKQTFAGYYQKEINGERILIAEPEKALVDYGYFVSLGRKKPLERLAAKQLSKEKLDQYIALFKRKNLKEIIKGQR